MKRIFLFFLFLSFSVSPGLSVSTPIADTVAVESVQQLVYTTKTGTKYHKSSCRYLRKSKIKTPKTEVQKSGYSACKVCKP